MNHLVRAFFEIFLKRRSFLKRKRKSSLERKALPGGFSFIIALLGSLSVYGPLAASDRGGAWMENDPDASSCFILSIDGGGIRGLIPAKILEYVEQEATASLKKLIRSELEKSGEDTSPSEDIPVEFHLAHAFDLLAGTSTGGIISLGLTVPQEDNLRIPRYQIKELLSLYKTKGAEIFPAKNNSGFRNIFTKKYEATGLEGLFKYYFKEERLAQAVTPVLITAYEMREERLHVLDSEKAKKGRGNFMFQEAARATSAAPTFFSGAAVYEGTEQYLFADGGIIANNPALIAFTTAQTRHKRAKTYLLSIGTGSAKKDNLSELKEKGLLGWGPGIASVMMGGVSALTHDLLETASQEGGNLVYVRLNPQLTHKREEMDNVDQENLHYLEAMGRECARGSRELGPFIDALVRSYWAKGHWFYDLQEEVRAQMAKGEALSLKKVKLGLFESFAVSLAVKGRQSPLKSLSLKGSQVEERGLKQLKAHFGELENLDLSQTGLPQTSLKFVVDKGASIVDLALAGMSLSSESLALFKNLAHLKRLDLSQTEFGGVKVQALINACPGLTALIVSHNPLSSGEGRKLLEELKRLESFNGSRASVTPGVTIALSQGIALKELILTHNRIDDAQMASLAQGLLACPTLTSLNLYHNEIGNQGCQALAPVLEALSSLTMLNLSSNGLRDEGALALSEALQEHKSLTSLNVKRSLIEDKGCLALARAWRDRENFKTLSLLLNDITSQGVLELQKIKESKRFKELLF